MISLNHSPLASSLLSSFLDMASLSAAAAVLNRSASIIARRSFASISTLASRRDVFSRTAGASFTHQSSTTPLGVINSRSFSTPPPTNNNNTAANIPPPTSLTAEAGLKAQDAMRLFIEHGIGKRALDGIAQETKQVS